jgi:site-specific DNA-methyltransferase (adenine-specific)
MLTPYYQDAFITLYCGDCRDVAPTIPAGAIDLWLADPPYGQARAGFRGAQVRMRGNGTRQGGVRLTRQALHEARHAMRLDAHYLTFGDWEGRSDLYDACAPYFPVRNTLVWWKARGGMGDLAIEYARDYEIILYGTAGRRTIAGKRRGSVIVGFPPVPAQRRLHPHEKPIPLLGSLIERHAPPGGTLFDPFAGSGPVLIAARLTGRHVIAVEIDEAYCEIAVRRLTRTALSARKEASR